MDLSELPKLANLARGSPDPVPCEMPPESGSPAISQGNGPQPKQNGLMAATWLPDEMCSKIKHFFILALTFLAYLSNQRV